MNAQSGKAEADRAKRKALLATARLVDKSGDTVSVRVRNLSQTGLGGVASDPLESGAAYHVELKGIGRVDGRIVWTNGTRFGMQFDREIELEALEMSDLGQLVPRQDEDFYRRFKDRPVEFRRPPLRTRK